MEPNPDVPSRRPEARACLQSLAPYAFALDEAALRLRFGLECVVRLCSNESPLGPSPLSVRAMTLAASRAHRYPQADNSRCLQAIGRHFGIAPDHLILGNGGDECIDLIIRILVNPGDNVLCFHPCFDVYRTQALICGAQLRQVPLAPDFTLPLDALAQAADERTVVAFVTSPDNPSGLATPREAMLKLTRRLPPHVLLVVDEAYVDFCDAPDAATCLPLLHEFPNLAVLRTFSKAHGLAGARLGFAALPPHLAEMARRAQIPFSVNLLAQEACLAALEDREHHTRTVTCIREGRAQLLAGLRARNCEVLPSQANFLMFRPLQMTAADLFQRLLERGVLIRGLGPNGLPDWLRVSVGTQEENAFFLECIG